MRFLVTTKCRANGRFVAAGEILDATNSDKATMEALFGDGRGRFISDAPPPASTTPPPPEPTVGSEPEAEPQKKRGRPRKE